MFSGSKPLAKRAPAARIQAYSRSRWRAVAVTCPASACEAALACKGKRFLCHEAPRLPLEACDGRRCECKYRHFDDRRAGPRRADERGATPARIDTNRRNGRDRRAQD